MTKYILLICFACCIFSCGDDEPKLVEQLSLTYEFTIDDQPIKLGENYELNGSTVMFEVANYYVHGLRMSSANDGVIIANEADHLLAGLNNTSSLIGLNIEPSTIVTTRVIIGVDDASNAQSETDFTERSTDDPLGLKDPAMHWNWNSGYKFVRFDGEVDTDGDGVVDTPIAYHIGSNPLRKTLELNSSINLESGNNDAIMSMDLNEFFKGVDFQLEENWDTHTGNNLDLAKLLVSNMESSFSLIQ